MKACVRRIPLFLLLAVFALASELKVGSLNCHLLFDPAVQHRGKVDDENQMTETQYRTKLENLAALAKGYQGLAFQEPLAPN